MGLEMFGELRAKTVIGLFVAGFVGLVVIVTVAVKVACPPSAKEGTASNLGAMFIYRVSHLYFPFPLHALLAACA